MPMFSYIGQGLKGVMEKGSIDAKNPEDAREQLRKRGISVESLMPTVSLMQQAPLQSKVAPAPAPVTTVRPQTIVAPKPITPPAAAIVEEEYVPLSDTFRLYAGWLLAWYSLVYLLGSYQFTKNLPFEIPFLEGLFLSPLVLKFAFGTFLFLLVTTIHRAMGRGIWKGIALTIVWLAVMTIFAVNV